MTQTPPPTSRLVRASISNTVSASPSRRNTNYNTTTRTDDNWRIIPMENNDDPLVLETIWNDRIGWNESVVTHYQKLYQTLRDCDDAYLKPRIDEALDCIIDTIRLYGRDSLICSFNGGKDAVVILHLVCAALAARVTFGEGLTRVTNIHAPRPLAFCLGTREGDPNAQGQGHFAPSSSWMPPFMRVNPILHWNYGHVWHFLRLYDIPYCSLYDQGYTSLGSVHNTRPCPALRIIGSTSTDNKNISNNKQYLPAYMLQDWDQERAGRISTPKKSNAAVSTKPDGSSLQSVSRTAPETESNIEKVDSNAGAFSSTEEEDDDANNADHHLPTTVAILIVGAEILKGFTPDTNTLVAARALRKHNVILKQVVVVSDTLHEIAEEIRRLRYIVDVIITSGGVGPTNDDVTMSGVAAALDIDMSHCEEMAALMRKKMNVIEWTPSLDKMAFLPRGAKLRYLSGPDAWPVLQCQNVFVLPGIPEFFGPKVESVAEYLSYHAKGLSYKVVLRVDETSIVDILNTVVTAHPSVSIGSYPFVSQPEFKTVVTVEGQPDDDAAVHQALGDLVDRVPAGSVLRVDNNMTLFGG